MNECKTKSGTRNTVNEYGYFLESNFVGVNRLLTLIHLNRNNDVKQFSAQKYYLPKGFIKNFNIIINGKNFHDQRIDCDIKQFEEIRKLTTGHSEDYTSGCFLDYKYVKNHYSLKAADLIRQKNLDDYPKAIQQIELVEQLKN